MIEVLQPGIYSTIQDSGRKGFEVYGMPPSGTFDPYLAGIANKLAGNAKDAPILEFALAGPSLKFTKPCVAAVAGLGCEYLLNGTPVEETAGFFIEPGSALTFKGMQGWFGYLAVSGGFHGERILNSVSNYPSAGIGSRLQKGQSLARMEVSTLPRTIDRNLLVRNTGETLEILPAIHTSLFDKASQKNFVRQPFQITSQSNRMGVRLNGPTISAPEISRSVPSLPGTIQIVRAGEPIILGPEGPTTGGYPQIAILTRTSWTTLASRRPGESIRFQWTNLGEARQKWERRNRIFEVDELWEPIS